jgi:hypothetical protein
MGFTRHLCYAAPALILAACNGPIKRDEAEVIAKTEATISAAQLQVQIDGMETQINALKDEQAIQARMISALVSDADSTTKTLNQAIRVMNENWANDMTRRGACGQEYVRAEDGSTRLRNRKCTHADLKVLE